jgi:hypothetical protein
VVGAPLLPQEAVMRPNATCPVPGTAMRDSTCPFRGNATPDQEHWQRSHVRFAPFGARHLTCPSASVASIVVMADAASLDERLEHIGTQLDWVRDYL